jgi:signal peptidase I
MNDQFARSEASESSAEAPADAAMADAAGGKISKSGERTGFARWLLELVGMVALAFALSLVIRSFVVQPFVVPSGSLEPTINIGDRVLVNKFVYRFGDPQRGDIVVFPDPAGKMPALIKRIVAVGGDTVDIRGGKLVLNGVPKNEPYVNGKLTEPGTVPMPLTIPQGSVFLMGDNRTNSGDARFFGPQPASGIQGKAFCVYWPIGEIRGL